MYHIKVTIGNIERKFVLDSGASDISISEDLENELIKNGVIKRENYKASALYKLADGSIVQKRRLTLPALTIGNVTLTNVSASIGIGSTPLLLGKSFLDRFKSWTIDNSSQILKLEK
jgi:aspartyl protease family protein